MTKPNTHGGPGRNQGRKVGPSGPASARLNIKCRPAELAAWKVGAHASGLNLSEWSRIKLSAPDSATFLTEAAKARMVPLWRNLKASELPQEGDECWNKVLERWERVNVPSMWMAGARRIRGTQFRTMRPG
jgi:hypothetical protein